jgi:hypothetical protein
VDDMLLEWRVAVVMVRVKADLDYIIWSCVQLYNLYLRSKQQSI